MSRSKFHQSKARYDAALRNQTSTPSFPRPPTALQARTDKARLQELYPITDRQLEILCFIIQYQADHQRPPTFREIGAALGIKSPNGVMAHLHALEKKGYIERDHEKSRGIRVIDGHAQKCPKCGHEF